MIMKRYYKFSTTNPEGKTTHFVIDVTQVSYIYHDEGEGDNGTTYVVVGGERNKYVGVGNKIIYDSLVKLMDELETAE
jgi:hypothetical protein